MAGDERRARRHRTHLALVLLVLGDLLFLSAPSDAATAAITARGAAWATSWPSESATRLAVQAPAAAQAGDVLVATIGVGRTGASSSVILSPPAGWTLASSTNRGTAGTLAVFTHVYASGERSYTFTTSYAVGGVGFVAAFGGVDAARPVDVSAGRTDGQGTVATTPSLTTTGSGDALVAAYFGYRGGGGSSVGWAPPSTMSEIGDLAATGGSRSGSLSVGSQTTAGATGGRTATVSLRVDWAIAALVALRPSGATPSPQPAVISGVQVSSVTSTGATVAWTTDQPTDTRAEYGTTTAYGQVTPVDPFLVTAHQVVLSGLAPDTTYHVRAVATTAGGSTTRSADVTFRTAQAPPSGGRVPLILDTDLWSSADDVGALAVGFALQQRGEADVIAISVNKRAGQAAVAANSWRCAAAVSQFYGDTVPIGTALPNNGSQVAAIDFIRPCAARASATTPTPTSAVSVYRRALADQPDSSVVIASFGFLGNLRDLLDSPGDAISPLSGRDLIARKVRRLVIMGGGYPTRASETNLAGDPVAAQRVASGWPTRVVWSGYEVGDAVRTGDTISLTHPTGSPVRIAYEAYVGARRSIESYDLTAAYHAVRVLDPVFGVSASGRNTVTSTGGNTFTTGSGDQSYLTLPGVVPAEDAIEGLLGVVPGAGTSPNGPTDDFSGPVLDATRWQVGTTGSSVGVANGQLEIAHPAGAWTTGWALSATPHDQVGRSLRLRLKRAANGGLGGSTYGETSVRLQVDGTHYLELFVAGGSLSAWVNQGTGAVNLTPTWPRYVSTSMQWIRFRESGGQVFFEYASGTTEPGTWQTLASAPTPFPLNAVRLALIAGSNVATTDVAQFDDVAVT